MKQPKQPAVKGVVLENRSNGLYRVEFPDGKDLICYLSGKMKMNHIQVNVGDEVEVIIDPMGGKTTNRIIRRS